MPAIKTNPLPNGLYWIDVFRPTTSSPRTPDGEPHWVKWASENLGRVVTLTTEEKPEPLLGGPKASWRLFRVTAPPTPFPFVRLGFPETTSDPSLKADDVVQKPPPEPSFDFSALFAGATPLLVIGALFLLSRKD